jgi:hypothetical protein
MAPEKPRRKTDPAQYIVQHKVAGEWTDMNVWEFCPDLYRKFLAYLDAMHATNTSYNRDNVRVNRVHYRAELPDFGYDGRTHWRINKHED